jgi:hypothetical protein
MLENQIDRVYCQGYLDSLLKYDQYKYTFGEIVDKDSPHQTFGFSRDILNMKCIDIDAIESNMSEQNDQTMDCACSIAKFDVVSRRYTSKKLLLVELKLNCISSRNLTKSVYVGKIDHSRDLLVGEKLHRSNIFLVTDKVKNSAKHDVYRISKDSNGSKLKNVVVMSPTEFNSFIGFEHNFPYIPINNPNDIIQSIKNASKDIDKLVGVIEYWKKEVCCYKSLYNHNEVENIRKNLKIGVHRIINAMPSGYDKEYITLCFEDI